MTKLKKSIMGLDDWARSFSYL